MTKATFNEVELKNIFINLVCNKLFVLAPIYFKQSSGFSAFFLITFVFLLVALIWNIFCKTSHLSLINMLTNQPLKYMFVSTIALISVLITSLTIQQYSLEVRNAALNTTPLWFISSTFLLSLFAIKIYGYTTIGSTGTLFVPIIFLTALFLVIISANTLDLYNFFPIMSINYTKQAKSFLLTTSMLFELVYLYLLPDLLPDSKKVRKTGNKIIAQSYINYCIIAIMFSIILPDHTNTDYTPFFYIIKQAHIGDTIVRFDSIFLILYCISAFIYISSMVTLIFKMLSTTYSKKIMSYLKPCLILILSLIALSISTGSFFMEIFSKYYFVLCVFTFIIPMLILIINKVLRCKPKNI